MRVAIDEDAPWSAAELTFSGVRHDGASYTVQVYLDDAEHIRDHDGGAGDEPAARFTVFGHGSCWGGEGHCEVPAERVSPYDYRRPHPPTPYDVRLDVGDALRSVGSSRVVVTAVASSVDPGADEPLQFRSLGLATFD